MRWLEEKQPHACVSEHGSISAILPGGFDSGLFLRARWRSKMRSHCHRATISKPNGECPIVPSRRRTSFQKNFVAEVADNCIHRRTAGKTLQVPSLMFAKIMRNLVRYVRRWQERQTIDLSASRSPCSFAISSLPERRNVRATQEASSQRPFWLPRVDAVRQISCHDTADDQGRSFNAQGLQRHQAILL